ncbi:TonB-dependent receptor, partial [candidate division WOR-3 bacterium]|nr:TonB-dependent receptor [candidate division WOR-3 bacterium]
VMFLIAGLLFSNESEELSLEELLNQTVVTAGKSVRISESPAIISVITAMDIEEMGVMNLYEVLSYVPGIEIMETYYGYTAIQFRGILQTHYNNKAALLLNGQPLYDQIVSCYYLEQIPVSAIERIEIIRGPCGVLYGTNAYAGVINIITKKGNKGTKASVKVGSFTTIQSEFAVGQEENGFSVFFAGGNNESKGYYKDVKYDEDDVILDGSFGNSSGSRQLGFYTDDKDAYENDYSNLFLSMSYKGFSLNSVYFENEKDKFGVIPTLCSTGERHLQGFGTNLKYSKSVIENKLNLNSIIWYDKIEKQERVNLYNPVLRAPGGHPTDQHYDGYKYGVQVDFDCMPFQSMDFRGGAGYEFAYASPYYWFYTDSLDANGEQIQNLPANAFTEAKDTYNAWGYLMGTITPMKRLNIIAGGRVNQNKQANTITIYNVGIIYLPFDDLSVKALYNSGFRNSSFFEKYVRTVNILAGMEDLNPEKINTIDVGIDYSLNKYSFRVNAFYSKTDELISRRSMDSLDLVALNAEPGFGSGSMEWTKGSIYENISGQTFQGVEVEFIGRPAKILRFFGNMSYKSGEDADKNELLFFAPITGNCGITIIPVKQFEISPSVQYIGKRDGHYSPIYPWNTWTESDYSIDAYTLVNLKITIKPSKELAISFIGNNLLDEDYEYPEYIRQSIPSIPGGPCRAFYVGISYQL